MWREMRCSTLQSSSVQAVLSHKMLGAAIAKLNKKTKAQAQSSSKIQLLSEPYVAQVFNLIFFRAQTMQSFEFAKARAKPTKLNMYGLGWNQLFTFWLFGVSKGRVRYQQVYPIIFSFGLGYFNHKGNLLGPAKWVKLLLVNL